MLEALMKRKIKEMALGLNTNQKNLNIEENIKMV
jgi:hypothetical protein